MDLFLLNPVNNKRR